MMVEVKQAMSQAPGMDEMVSSMTWSLHNRNRGSCMCFVVGAGGRL